MKLEEHIKDIKNLSSSSDFDLPEGTIKELGFLQDSISPYIMFLFSLSEQIKSQKDLIKKDYLLASFQATLNMLNEHITKKLNLELPD